MASGMSAQDTDSRQTEDHREQSAGSQESCVETLRECVHRAVMLYLEDLDGYEVGNIQQLVISEIEPPMIETLLDYTDGNQTRAAQLLGMSRSTLRKRMVHYGIQRDT